MRGAGLSHGRACYQTATDLRPGLPAIINRRFQEILGLAPRHRRRAHIKPARGGVGTTSQALMTHRPVGSIMRLYFRRLVIPLFGGGTQRHPHGAGRPRRWGPVANIGTYIGSTFFSAGPRSAFAASAVRLRIPDRTEPAKLGFSTSRKLPFRFSPLGPSL